MKTYFAPGKIMLCGEYAVLAGVQALAFPVHLGQWMRIWEVPTTQNGQINWESKDHIGNKWFECKINSDSLQIGNSNNENVANVLLKLLKHIQSQKPWLFQNKFIRIETNTEFALSSGLGTSSSLVVLLSKWSGVDAFELQAEAFGGSGYDVACSMLSKPIKYWIENEEPSWDSFQINKELTENWHIVFPGNKRNSREALTDVKDQLTALQQDSLMQLQLKQISGMIANANSTAILEAGLEMWQAMLADFLKIPKSYEFLNIQPIKGGLCKWLGAWGGDMILINETMLQKNLDVFENMEICKWNELVIME